MLIDKKGSIYKMTFPDGRLYIGATTAPLQKRFGEHLSASKNPTAKTKIAQALRSTDPKDVKVEKIDFFENLEEAEFQERHYIEKFQTVSTGLNTAPGGNGVDGYQRTEEDRKRISVAQKERFRDPVQREISSEKTKEWIRNNPEKSQERTARALETARKPENRQRASEKTKEVIRNNPEIREKQTESLKKRYENDPDLKEQISRSLGGSPVTASKQGESDRVFPSIGEAGRVLGLSTGNIGSVLQGRRNQTGGYKFSRKK